MVAVGKGQNRSDTLRYTDIFCGIWYNKHSIDRIIQHHLQPPAGSTTTFSFYKNVKKPFCIGKKPLP
jgi:hypothetical protein